jgi:hypothetical protein
MKDTGSTYTSNLRVQNSSSISTKLWIEPWGDAVSIPPGVTVDVVAKGPTGDCLEIVNGDSDIVIHGWPQSTLAVFQSGELIREYPIPAPSTPQRGSGAKLQ